MTNDELFAKIHAKFPSVAKAATEVKGYLTVRLVSAAELTAVASWLKEQGFDYLDMVTATDWKGPVNLDGYIRDPNPNVFLPEGATPQVDAPTATAGVPYRDAFELTYCLSDLKEKAKVFLKLDVSRAEPSAPSLAPLFKAADWQERELFDLFGVVFSGHPNLKKILTPDFIAGHPLRKDYVHVKDKFD
ncbi:MAG TPA: NADH-quinone oxidoreductase subunit C [Elusimicrobiota bacterium]|jgi:NADH:ubiquinone oxidoreductase subunit C|nr:NADH-quinone oxidoreductase subunit C [Elusimicrobiota bacterium]